MSNIFNRKLALRVWVLTLLGGAVGVVSGAAYLFTLAADGVQQCSQIAVTTDKTDYLRGETANIHVEYVHLTSYCFEALVFHIHEIIVDANGLTIARWNTTGDSVRTINWTTPSGALSYTYGIRACEWYSGLQLVECASTTIRVGFALASRAAELAVGIGTVLVGSITVIVGVGFYLKRRRILSKPASEVPNLSQSFAVERSW